MAEGALAKGASAKKFENLKMAKGTRDKESEPKEPVLAFLLRYSHVSKESIYRKKVEG